MSLPDNNYCCFILVLGTCMYFNTEPSSTACLTLLTFSYYFIQVLDVYGNKGSFFNPGFPQDYRDSLDLLYTGHFNYSHPQWVRLTLEYSLDGVMPACADYIHIIGQNFSRCGKVNSQREQCESHSHCIHKSFICIYLHFRFILFYSFLNFCVCSSFFLFSLLYFIVFLLDTQLSPM